MENLRILYKNLNLILETEIRKLKECIEEFKSDYQQQDNKLNVIVKKTANILQEYEFIEYEINTMKKKVIGTGEKVTSATLNKIFSLKNPDSQIIFIMNMMYEILKNNIDYIEDNSNANNNSSNINNSSINTSNFRKEKNTWDFLKINITYKSILLLLSFISETSNLTLSKDIIENAKPIITKYNHYKDCYINTFPEILIIIDFIKILIVYYTKLALLKKLYISNKNKNTKMETIQLDLGKHSESIQKAKLLLYEVTKDYNALKKNINNKIIYGYNILEKYSLYEKYTVGKENIYNYDAEYYNNYGGGDYNNKVTKIKYVIKLNKKYRNKEKFIQQLSLSLISYTKGIRKINKEKFIQNIKENKNSSLNKNSNTNSKNKIINRNNTSINNNNNNVLKRSIENNNSSANLYKSFQNNSFVNVTRNNSTPYRSENSRNNIFLIKSFVDSYPTFDNFFQLSNRNLLLKDGLNASSLDWEQTKNSTKNNINSREFNSLRNSMNKKIIKKLNTNNNINKINNTYSNNNKNKNKNNLCFRNLKQQQINLKFENEQWSPCSLCCKSIKNKFNKTNNNK